MQMHPQTATISSGVNRKLLSLETKGKVLRRKKLSNKQRTIKKKKGKFEIMDQISPLHRRFLNECVAVGKIVLILDKCKLVLGSRLHC